MSMVACVRLIACGCGGPVGARPRERCYRNRARTALRRLGGFSASGCTRMRAWSTPPGIPALLLVSLAVVAWPFTSTYTNEAKDLAISDFQGAPAAILACGAALAAASAAIAIAPSVQDQPVPSDPPARFGLTPYGRYRGLQVGRRGSAV